MVASGGSTKTATLTVLARLLLDGAVLARLALEQQRLQRHAAQASVRREARLTLGQRVW